jgi:hypothetical protein
MPAPKKGTAMSQTNPPSACPDCAGRRFVSRRRVIKSAVGGVAAASLASACIWSLSVTPRALAAEALARKPMPETLVAQLFKSLTESQRKVLAFPFDHPLRSEVNNNWMIVKESIKSVLAKDQIALVRDIFNGMHSEEYAKRVMEQVEHDNSEDGGFDSCSIALFGEPGDLERSADPLNGGRMGKSKFEFVLAGRHVTRRCDGNSVDGAAFGGPIFYGHAAEGFNEKANHPGNVYWYQAKQANAAFQALDGKQRKLALLDTDPRKEQATKTVALSGKSEGLAGIPMTELTRDQQDLVRKTMADLLAPFRKADADEAMKLIEAGGFDKLHMSFYSKLDIGKDGVWDVWQIEGPSMLWYFRGAPHVHTWVHVREPART